jgi:hypothetical protein
MHKRVKGIVIKITHAKEVFQKFLGATDIRAIEKWTFATS